MGNIFKTILSILLVVVLVYSGIGILWANNESVSAESYLHEIGNQVSAANLQETVIQDCVAQASQNGYTLTYDIVKDVNGFASYVNLTLEYEYSVWLLSLSDVHTKTMTVY